MFEAKLTKKTELPDGRLEVTVEYSDGVDTKTETFIPSDKQGYFYRTEEVKRSLTTAKELKEEDNIGKVITLEEVVIPQAEQEKQAWFAAYRRLEQLEMLEAKAFLTGARLTALTTKIAELKTFLNANIKVEYLDSI